MEEKKQEVTNQKPKKKNGINLPTAIVVAGMLIAGALALPKVSVQTNSQAAAGEAQAQNLLEAGGTVLIHPVDENDYRKGAQNPKLTLVEFSDFGCHFCGKFHPVVERLLAEYPEDLAWVYRQLPYRHIEASRAAECVGDRLGNEAFWSFTDTLFENQSSITQELMEMVVTDLGMDIDDFRQCQASEKIDKLVQRDFAEANLIGVRGTPHTVVVTDQGREFSLRGALQYEQLKGTIDTLLGQ